ncbi:hypothetical protein PQO01_10220 [Lentisphaera marina]|nr:hypothetical protein [Lentisphaera marina]MDD7985327.1 hypothetical protein [Lentisphaera marina]
MRQNGLALYSYADDNDRYWPRRTVPHLHHLEYKSRGRSLLADYISLDSLFCPLNKPDFDPETDTTTTLGGSYEMYYGQQLISADGHENSALLKMGDRITWGWDGINNSFSVLLADADQYYSDSGLWISTHPDNSGVMSPSESNVSGLKSQLYRSNNSRGLLDRNFLYEDGSVKRVNNILPPGPSTADHDPRMARVRANNAKSYNLQAAYLPVEVE